MTQYHTITAEIGSEDWEWLQDGVCNGGADIVTLSAPDGRRLVLKSNGGRITGEWYENPTSE